MADQEGIAVIPADQTSKALQIAQTRAHKDSAVSLEQWQADHYQKVQSSLEKLGFTE